MRYIIRPATGYLALVDSALGDNGKPVTWALPDAEFWAWLHASGTYDEMLAENGARMDRVEANGVGVLHDEKAPILDAKLTNDKLVSDRPPEKPVLLAAEVSP